MISLLTHPANSRALMRSIFRRRPLLGVVLSLCAVGSGAFFVSDVSAHHPLPATAYAIATSDVANAGMVGDDPFGDWNSKDQETCAYNQHHSGFDVAGTPQNGHASVQLLNQYRVDGEEYPLVKRLKNGGLEVSPIFNCLPNFWGWVVYREVNGVLEFVEDNAAGDKRPVASPQGYALHSSGYYVPKPQHERSSYSNTVSFPESAELMADVGYGNVGTATPMLEPKGLNNNDGHYVFKYNSVWDNDENLFTQLVPVVTGSNSVTSIEQLFVKVWTAEAIKKEPTAVSDPTVVSPWGNETDLDFTNWNSWPNENDISARDGFSVSGHQSRSIFDKILLRLRPMFWIAGITKPAIISSLDIACDAWSYGANVQSDGCQKNTRFPPHTEGSEHWLSEGSEGVPPMQMVNDDGTIKIPVPKGYEGVDADRQVFFTRRASESLGGGENGESAPILARLRERGYPVQVAAPQQQVGPPWPADAPAMTEVKITTPPIGAPPSYIPTEVLSIKVSFSEPVFFVPWEPTAAGNHGLIPWDDRIAEAASYQSFENLRMKLVGIEGCPGASFSYEKRKCESARFDLSANATDGSAQRTWTFVYDIPEEVYTNPHAGMAIAADNLGQRFDKGSGAPTTPFWFVHDAWREANPSDPDGLEPHFQVGASFSGGDRLFDATEGKFANDFSIVDTNVRLYDIADLTLRNNFAFRPYNSIAKGDILDIKSYRTYARDLLSFDGLIKGTPASVTYERGYVVLGWTVMMNLVFALFVLFIAWAAISSVVKPMLGSQDTGAGWKEMAPRIVFAAIAVASSFWWCRLLIDLADAISRYVAEALAVNPGDILYIGIALRRTITFVPDPGVLAGPQSTGNTLLLVGVLFVLLFFLVMGLLIMGQLILRIVLLNLLMIIAPIGLSMFVLPDTAGWGRKWVQLWLITLFRHALQLVGLGLALSFVRTVMPIGDEAITQSHIFWALLLGCFALYLTWKLPSMMGDGGISEGFLQTMTMVTNMAAHLPGAMRTGINIAAAAQTGGVGAAFMTGVGASSSAIQHFNPPSRSGNP